MSIPDDDQKESKGPRAGIPEMALPPEFSRPTPGTRIPVKVHRRVCLIQTEDAILAEELLANKKLAQDLIGRLTDRVLLVRTGRVQAVIKELQRMGHTPQVQGTDQTGP